MTPVIHLLPVVADDGKLVLTFGGVRAPQALPGKKTMPHFTSSHRLRISPADNARP